MRRPILWQGAAIQLLFVANLAYADPVCTRRSEFAGLLGSSEIMLGDLIKPTPPRFKSIEDVDFQEYFAPDAERYGVRDRFGDSTGEIVVLEACGAAHAVVTGIFVGAGMNISSIGVKYWDWQARRALSSGAEIHERSDNRKKIIWSESTSLEVGCPECFQLGVVLIRTCFLSTGNTDSCGVTSSSVMYYVRPLAIENHE
jgi:hypothetical protein